ncbi:MAG: hypothetical protein IKX83_02410 [Clostridia bacterium]|nr:hypothetical protein [Clostridia bacterium]
MAKNKKKAEAPAAQAAAPEETKRSKGKVALLGTLAVTGVALAVVVGAVLYMVNPWYIPQILKRNYPEWFDAHPLISRFIPLT